METILVTGASRGIGRALVAEGRARGHRMIAGVRHGEDALHLSAQTGGGVQALVLDVTDAGSLAAAAASLGGPVDVLVNNAGVIGPDCQSVLDMDFDGFLRTLDVNTLGPLRVVQAFLPHLRQSVRPRILTITSQMGMMAYRKSDRVAYRASKSAVNKVMQALATDLEDEGIAVQLIHPGWVRTDMGGPGADIAPEESAAGIMDRIGALTLDKTATFVDYAGRTIPW